MGPAFFRFPGGNNLEGDTIEGRWKWNETIGPLKDRPGRATTWQYGETGGFGLIEYMRCLHGGLRRGGRFSVDK